MLAGLLGFIPSLACTSRKHGLFSLMLKPSQSPNGYFLLNEHGDLSFLCRYFNSPTILFMFRSFKKKITREKCVIARNTRLPTTRGNRKVILRTLLARKYWVDSASFRAFLPRNSSLIR